MEVLKKMSRFELRDLLIAWFCLAVAFTLGVSGGIAFITNPAKIPVDLLVLTFVIAVVTVGTAFVLHELAHKFMASRYGYWAEFRKNVQMLLIAVVVAVVTGIVFAVPGVTVVNTAGRRMNDRERGMISVGGIVINLVFAVPFLVIMLAGIYLGGVDASPFAVPGFLFYLGLIGLQVNAMIAFFNMLPVGPLDGKKIFVWNRGVFAVLILVSFLAVVAALQPWVFTGLW